MTDVPGPVVECEIRIDARPESVFPFLVDADRVMRWMGMQASLDPRPGGALSVLVHEGNRASGQFLEIEPPHRIVFTWGWENPEIGLPPGSSRVEILLTADADGTLVRLRHLDLPEALRADHTQGWTHLLAQLATAVMAAAVVAAASEGEQQHMSARAAALADRVASANATVIATIEACSDEQARQVCDSEGWSVAVAAHHVAATYTALGDLVRLLANGRELPPITMEMIDAGNARHAEEFATIGRDETLAALRTNGAAAESLVRGLSDAQLDRSAPMTFAGGAPWSAADIIERIMIEHALDHGRSIQATLAASPVA